MKILTKDLFEAAFLLSKGMKVSRVLGSPRTVLLELEGSEELNILKEKYQNREAEANVHSLKNQLREVKDLVFTVVRNHQGSDKICCNL